jgi:hypothetical protein
LTTGSIPHDNFSSVYLVFTKFDHMIPLWKGKNAIYFGVIGSKVKVTYYEYNFWQQSRFRTITLVLYIGSLPNLATWFPCGRGRTLFILGSLPLYRLIIYIDGYILWCTHFLFLYCWEFGKFWSNLTLFNVMYWLLCIYIPTLCVPWYLLLITQNQSNFSPTKLTMGSS